ncbi:hypothetical protein [Solibacillus sp. FSL W8-0372]|uniref:hypothetical protein n=1 Tax=Solibacillus sp. FSL W8-0372 TaxID=2921713 RepID=UPI0030D342B3
MNNILKWVGLTIIALLIIRFILNTIFSISTWAFQTILTIFTSSAMGVVLFLTLLAIVGYILYVKHKANRSYKEVYRQTKLEGKSKQALTSQQALSAPAKDLTDFMQQFSIKELSALVNQYYKNDKIGFGEVGATEFIGSVLLAEYKPQLQGAIQTGHLRVFKQQWGPLQFSDFMDNIVEQSGVPYAKWSEMCRLLYTVHPALKNHPCAKPAAVVLAREK